jgi:hypothetical protein
MEEINSGVMPKVIIANTKMEAIISTMVKPVSSLSERLNIKPPGPSR